MTGTKPYSASFDAFYHALGYPHDSVFGFCIHSEKTFSDNQLLFCYPSDPIHQPPSLSGMYYYMVLARFFRYNLVSKAGDVVDVRGHHKNLLYYCKPRRLRKINVCDFIYYEIQLH